MVDIANQSINVQLKKLDECVIDIAEQTIIDVLKICDHKRVSERHEV